MDQREIEDEARRNNPKTRKTNVVAFENGITLEEDIINLTVDNLETLEDADLTPPPKLMEPWFPALASVLLHAKAGTGKTMFAQTVAYALATGQDFYTWKVPAPIKVLYIDAEMIPHETRQRFKNISTMFKSDINPSPNLMIMNYFRSETELNLSNEKHRDYIIEFVKKENIKCIVIDNVSLLCPDFIENESQSWSPMHTFESRLRKAGASVLRIMHTGKTGLVRATSKVFDAVHTTIYLEKKEDEEEQSAKFIVKFEKARGFNGKDTQPIEFELVDDYGKFSWKCQTLANSTYEQVVELAKAGNCNADIAAHLRISKVTVHRHIQKGVKKLDLDPDIMKINNRQGRR